MKKIKIKTKDIESYICEQGYISRAVLDMRFGIEPVDAALRELIASGTVESRTVLAEDVYVAGLFGSEGGGE